MKLTLARAITCTAERCRVQPLDGGEAIDAPLAPRMIAAGVVIRPEMIVALDRGATPATITYRYDTRPVEALAGDRLTLHGKEFRFVDVRPAAERAIPISVGDTVAARSRLDSPELEVYDTVESGRPRHPERLEAEFPRIEAIYVALPPTQD